MTHWDWMHEHWWVGFWLWIWGMACAVGLVKYGFKYICVLFRGWPPPKIINHYPSEEEAEAKVRDVTNTP